MLTTYFLTQCVERMIGLLQKYSDSGEPVDVYRYFQGLTLDVIAKTALGDGRDLQVSEAISEKMNGGIARSQYSKLKIMESTVSTPPESKQIS